MPYEKTIKVTPELKKKLKRNFFHLNKPKFPSWYARDILLSYLSIVGALFVAFYFNWTSFVTYTLVIGLIILAFYFAYRWVTPYFKELQQYKLMPSANQMENWLIKDIKDIVKPAAVNALSLNPLTISPDNFLIVIHPIYWEVNGIDSNIIERKQVEDYFIYTIYKIQIVALSENYISYYSCIFNWLDNEIVNPNTLEFFFEDISSIRSEIQDLGLKSIELKEIIPKEKPKQEEKSEENEEEINEEQYEEEKVIETEEYNIGPAKIVIIQNKSGEQIRITVEIPSLSPSPRITLKAEKVVQLLRIMLRHRRFGELFYIEKKDEEQDQKQEE